MCVKLSYSFINDEVLKHFVVLYCQQFYVHMLPILATTALRDLWGAGWNKTETVWKRNIVLRPWCPVRARFWLLLKALSHHIVDVCIFIRNVCLALENILPEYENKPYWQLSASCRRWSTESDIQPTSDRSGPFLEFLSPTVPSCVECSFIPSAIL